MRRFVRWLLVLALSLSIGLQWAVVQGAAWVGMIATYSRTATISQALTMTFDGAHPCKLCKAAQRGESTQDAPKTGNSPVKLVLAAPEHDAFFFEPQAPAEAVFAAAIDGRLVVRPAVPPPRIA